MQVIERPLLDHVGLAGAMRSWHNLSPAELYEHATARGEANIVSSGALTASTGQHTGRSPKDKFFVEEPGSQDKIWWHTGNRSIAAEHFDQLLELMAEYVRGNEVYVRDVHACADPRYRLRVRVVTQYAWHSLFANNLFIRPSHQELEGFEPDFTVIALPGVKADPALHGTRSETFILLNFARRMVLIGGTRYAGEIKKSIFTALNHLLPDGGALPMHCSANVGQDGNVALFFGLSGTGKTTLSTDPERTLIGDDEHGWGERGIFNFEGGSYAKTIRISQEAEPLIFSAVHRFGTVLENVVIDPHNRQLDLDDASLTENTRAAFPLSFVPRVDLSGIGSHPKHVIFLTADAFGVLPPIARLSPEQAQYYFLSGYTAKVAGTEKGITEPQPNFSTCFGAPFMVWHPTVYARMLGERLARHGSTVWLINTGWTGGAYGTGSRIGIEDTRAMVRAALGGHLSDTPTYRDEYFGLQVPVSVPGVADEVLRPRDTWQDTDAYERQARKLATMFADNFRANFSEHVSAEIAAAGPRAQ